MSRSAFDAFGLRCEPGTQVRGWARIGELNSGTEVRLPVRIAHGGHAGPVIGMNAMLHGDEYNGYAVINRLFDELDCRELRGTLVGLPVANPLALHSNTRIHELEYERLNLNRVFPGTAGGFQMERLAHLIFDEGVRRADAWLDFHEGGRDFIARYLIVGEEGGAATADLEMARWFGEGVPITIDVLTPERARLGRGGTVTTQCRALGKRALGVELGGGGQLVPAFVETGLAGARNVLRGLGALPGARPDPQRAPAQHVCRETFWPRPSRGGFFEQDVTLGQVVAKDEVVGRVRDLFGSVAEEIRAPFASVILDTRHTATIQTGEWTVKCGRLDGPGA